MSAGRSAAAAGRAAGGGGGGGGGGVGGTKAVGTAALADKVVQDRYIADQSQKIPNERAYWDAVSNLGKRYNDYKNKGNSFGENLGNMALGALGVSEIDPTQQALGAGVGNPKASWGVDPLGVALGIGGMASGLPIGSAYTLGKKVTGYQGPMVGFDGFHDQSPFSNEIVGPMTGASVGATGVNPGGQMGGDRTGVGGPRIQGPVQGPTPSIFSQQPPAQTGGNPVPPGIFPKPPTQTAFQVPGGKPYGFNLFGRAA
jgi:hypothetical protein